LKVSRTIADLAGSEQIEAEDVSRLTAIIRPAQSGSFGCLRQFDPSNLTSRPLFETFR